MQEQGAGLHTSPSVLETVLKYGATIGVLSYGVGFLLLTEEFGSYPLAVSDVAYNAPEIIGFGAILLMLFALVVFAPFVIRFAVESFKAEIGRPAGSSLLGSLGWNIAREFLSSGPHSLFSRMHLNNGTATPSTGLDP